ncbi:4-hydroxybenzoate 3-monooxygenase [Intrasporangium chromatireducens Q5-1]|uniref:4-hydroxybenzoate 3-monooxygenase n=1 Tax=Intrasporangium chromatireducens Q5-1 TaxID=584657 RepID=W9GPU0_9MICO|nr:4-hydroxybenzoate 3-monooxygenase [Intrasporangium chromatireducens]EWT05909.1 4-hydroxybenzoate 3-monooxygenase [Intrasporangium chromatireducens Q5-1]
MPTESTTVGIVGAGPAGLMLSHLLALSGIESVAIDIRSREEIEHTNRAGILEQDSVRLLTDTGVDGRVLTDGYEHHGIELRFGGEGHRINFQELVGASVWLYPQTDVFIDLANARARDGGDVRFGVTNPAVREVTGRPVMSFTDADGVDHEVRCDYLVGSDGSRSMCRHELPESLRRQYYKEYPFAWFGIMVEAPPSAPELIYARHDRGFALISQRTDVLQRMYFQCSPTEDIDAWSDDRIWEELQTRVEGGGFRLIEGPITEKTVLPFRSFVCEPMRHGNLFLAGDAAHTVPPTGAKGLNLALQDVKVLHELLDAAINLGKTELLDTYSTRALERVWKAQQFSYRMTTMLHSLPDETPFDARRQLGQLNDIVSSRFGSAHIAECYTGWPTT